MPPVKRMKARTPRVTRPSLDRTEPDRSWATLFGGKGQGAARVAAAQPAAPTNAVRRGVELGYQVIDEYVKQGRTFARVLSEPGAVPGVAGSLAGAAPADGGDLSVLTGRMMQYASELSSMWMEAVGRLAATAPLPGAGVTQAAASTPAAKMKAGAPASTAAGPAWRLVLEISSAGSTRCSVDLAPASLVRPLVVQGLRADKGKARITGVGVTRREDACEVLVRVDVPKKQAPGRYTGAIVDAEDSRLLGTLRLELTA
jgi:hypothetical protein